MDNRNALGIAYLSYFYAELEIKEWGEGEVSERAMGIDGQLINESPSSTVTCLVLAVLQVSRMRCGSRNLRSEQVDCF